MFLVGIVQWWYGEGWRRHARLSGLGILRMADFFSIGLLARTLFSPYRQISAGRVRGPLPVQLRAFADRLFSRVIGGVFRTILTLIFRMLKNFSRIEKKSHTKQADFVAFT